MRLPYLQVSMELMEQVAPDLQVLLGCEEAAAGWGLLKLFRWALGRCPNDDAPPSAHAVVEGPQATKLIANAAGFGAEPERFVEACCVVRPAILERMEPGGIRIRGLDRYDAAWGKNNKEAWAAWKDVGRLPADPGPEPERNRPETGVESARKTQTQTQIETTPLRARAELPQGDRPPPAPTPAVPPPAAPPRVDLPQLLDVEHQRARGRSLEWGRSRDRVALERAVGELAAEHGDAEVLRRLRNALTVPREKFPFFGAVGDLLKHWGQYAEPFTVDLPRRAVDVLPQGMGSNPPETPEVTEQRRAEARDRLRRQHPRAARVLDLAAARAASAPPAVREDALLLRALRLLPFGERVRIYGAAQLAAVGGVELSAPARRVARRFHLAQAVAGALGVQAHEMQYIAKVGGAG